ncbi:metal-dependent hydrolase [Geomicrobium sp. JCM 19037]|uniref:cyclase family protein n=1 Tax=Geomicrobium sp. JCM 19037 TaxID=1460634 RepID=UPI00045F48E5|nr:cyclase family protein [Geomicrobium sp. JCM 19037]GAK05615.1 metal-dependent hydrolase [Geomicrobium sp. JCM 19037]
MKIIDLTAPIESGMSVYPGDPEVNLDVATTIEQQGFEVRRLSLGSHTGTHVDAFSHMHAGKHTIDQIPLTTFVHAAVLVDDVHHLPERTGLVFRQDVGIEDFDAIVKAAPPFAAGEIDVDLEKALLGHGIVTYTNLVNLGRVPVRKPFLWIGLPLHIKGGDGSPVRAVAVFNE